MAYRNFPKLNGIFINLRELSVNDAKHITSFMNYNIAKICIMYLSLYDEKCVRLHQVLP